MRGGILREMEHPSRGYVTAGFVVLVVLLMLASVVWTAPSSAQGEDIFIFSDGSVWPSTAPIQNAGNRYYTLTDDLLDKRIRIERSNMVLDGADHTMSGPNDMDAVYAANVVNVTVKNILVQGCNRGFASYDASDLEISHNRFSGTTTGVSAVWNVREVNISENIFDNCTVGIDLSYGSQFEIWNNSIESCSETAINDMDCAYLSVADNRIRTSEAALGFWFCTNVTARGNVLTDNNMSFVVQGNSLQEYAIDIDASNTIDSRPIQYWVGATDSTVPADAGFVGLVDCTNVTVEGQTIENNGQGIMLAYTVDSVVRNNTLLNSSWAGVLLWASVNVTVSDNVITTEAGYETWSGVPQGIALMQATDDIVRNNTISKVCLGIYITDGSFSNDIHNNTISECELGVDAEYSSETRLRDNSITSCSEGVYFVDNGGSDITRNEVSRNALFGIDVWGMGGNIVSGNRIVSNIGRGIRSGSDFPNLFYGNWILNNTLQAFLVQHIDYWDNDYPAGGNYWSDYMGPDDFSGPAQDVPGSDGIGDVPYAIDYASADRYPLILPYPPDPSQRIPRGPIYIYDDSQFTPENGVTGGSGVASDPYVIEGWSIVPNQTAGVEIWDTTAHVVIRNTTVRGGLDMYDGIWLENSRNVDVEDCDISMCYYGYSASYSQNLTVRNLRVDNCTATELLATGSQDIWVSDCEFLDTGDFSAWFMYCSHVMLQNTTTMRCELAVEADYSDNVTFMNNTIGDSWYGFWFYSCTNSSFIDNSDWGLGSEGYYIDGCSGISVMGNSVVGADEGIELDFTNDCVVSGNYISEIVNYGLYLWACSDILASDNVVDEAMYGLWADGWSSPIENVTFEGNEVSSCLVGVSIYQGYGLDLMENTIQNCSYGLEVFDTTYITVSGNYFMENPVQATVQNLVDARWDNGYPQGGNFWSDYSGVDAFWGPRQSWAGSDGIGDTPYSVDSYYLDNYPLMQPFPPSPVLTPRGPILITGNSEFTPANGVVGGSGTQADPFIIEGWDIEASTARGIEIRNTDANFIVRQCYVHSGGPSYNGIELIGVSNGVLSQCMLQGIQYNGIELIGVADTVVEDCAVIGCAASGIYTMGGQNISFVGNLVSDSVYYGLVMYSDENFIVRGNDFESDGIVMMGSDLNDYSSHTITPDNSVNGQPILYYKNMSGVTLADAFVGQLIVVNCTDVDVSNVRVSDTDTAVMMYHVSDVTVSSSIIQRCTAGIGISDGENLDLSNNTILETSYNSGIVVTSWANATIVDNYVDGGWNAISVSNVASVQVHGNTIVGVSRGLWLTGCSDSEVYWNVLEYCSWGIQLERCVGARVYHNDLFYIGIPATDDRGSENLWDSGYPSGGNYWSSFVVADTKHGPSQNLSGPDGIGDLPYVIDGNSSDRYPLTHSMSLDNTSPWTTDNYDGLWHSEDFTITLIAADAGSGVLDTYYRINGGPVMSVTDDGYPLITEERWDNSLEYWSVDRAGNEEFPHKTRTTIRLDKSPPTGSIIVNGGAVYATNRTLSLSLSATDMVSGVFRMRFSTDNSSWGSWLPYATSRLYPVALPDGVVTVYVQFSDVVGIVSIAYSDSIIVDTMGPVANAGGDRVVDEDVSVGFDGSGSSDQNGIVSYNWTIMTPVPVYLSGMAVSYTFSQPGTYSVYLRVTDAVGLTGTDMVTVTVTDITPPTAEAGDDLTIDQHSIASFDGSGSADNVAVTNWTWTFNCGSFVQLWGAHAMFTFHYAGSFEVTLTVTDGSALSSTDTLVVNVQDTDDPVADAGNDLLVNAGSVVTMNGSRSSDNVGIVAYVWTFLDSGPVQLDGEVVQHAFSSPGVYLVTLEVADARGNTDSDTLVVTVNGPPTADAGADQRVNAGSVVALSGEGSSDDYGVVNYTWSFLYEGATTRLYSGVGTFQFSVPGSYLVTLTVVDAGGLSDAASVTITVNGPPDADAGTDVSIALGSLLTLDGTGSSDDLDPLNYTWYIAATNGTGSGTLWPVFLYGPSPTFMFTDPDIYIVTLTVRDLGGLSSADVMFVTVRDEAPPVAVAGPDIEVGEMEVASLDGSSSTDNVGIVSFVWTFNDGTDRTLVGERVSYSFRTPGVYIVTLDVVDAAGNHGTDTVLVTVPDVSAPVAVISPPSRPTSGADLVFSANASSDNVGVVVFLWEFGDGSAGAGQVEVHKYLRPGTYVVNLTVIDDAGNQDRSSYTVVVRGEGSPLAIWLVGGTLAAALIVVALYWFIRRNRHGASDRT